MKNSWTELNQYELNQFFRAFKSHEQYPCHFTCKTWVYSNQTLFSVHFLFSSSVQNAVDVYLFYSEDTLRIIWELKNKKAAKKYVIKSDPTNFI